MNNRKFVASVILTIMDALVFMLCVDTGFTPIAAVGACYVALRLFTKDGYQAVNLIGTFGDTCIDAGKALVDKYRESKKTPAIELHDNV